MYLHVPPCISMYLLASSCTSTLSVRNLCHSSLLFSPSPRRLSWMPAFFACKWSVKLLMLKVRATAFLLPLEGQVIEQVLPPALLGSKVIELKDALFLPWLNQMTLLLNQIRQHLWVDVMSEQRRQPGGIIPHMHGLWDAKNGKNGIKQRSSPLREARTESQ